MNQDKTLIFVYNVDSSPFAQISDYLHKAISPETYRCNLCKLTHSNFGAKKEWKQFIDSLSIKTEFMHRDQFVKLYPNLDEFEFPLIALNTGNPELLVSKSEIDNLNNLNELKRLIKIKLK